MPKNKKQHYVNKAHLRMFAVDPEQTHIGTYIKKTNKYISKVVLSTQAYKDYFYGKDLHTEEMLGKLETPSGKIIEQMQKNIIIDYNTEEYGYLLMYIFTLDTRTLKAVNNNEKLLDEFFKKRIKEIFGFTDGVPYQNFCNSFEVHSDEPAKDFLNFIFPYALLIFDLKLKLLVNETSKSFITSDHPIIKYNQFLENSNQSFDNANYQAPGLQLFFPVSPTRTIMLYDSRVYKVGKRDSSIIVIKDSRDVDSLNVLQYLNAYNQIYFNNNINEEYINSIIDKAKQVKSLGGRSVQTKGTRIIGITNNCISTDLSIGFCFEVEKAKELREQGKIPSIRDPNLVRHSQYYSRITKGRLPHPKITHIKK